MPGFLTGFLLQNMWKLNFDHSLNILQLLSHAYIGNQPPTHPSNAALLNCAGPNIYLYLEAILRTPVITQERADFEMAVFHRKPPQLDHQEMLPNRRQRAGSSSLTSHLSHYSTSALTFGVTCHEYSHPKPAHQLLLYDRRLHKPPGPFLQLLEKPLMAFTEG